MIAGTAYLLRGELVTAVVAWRQQRTTERVTGPHLHLRTTTPRNVLIRHTDGTEAVRPFRGLRKAVA